MGSCQEQHHGRRAIQKEILTGSMLGDGHMFSSNIASSFKLVQTTAKQANIDYLMHTYELFKDLINNAPKVYSSIRSLSGRESKTYSHIGFTTRSLKSLLPIYNLWYKNKVKVLPSNISDLLTPLAIAHWIMGDGCVLKEGGMLITTQNFTKKEVVYLIKILLDCPAPKVRGLGKFNLFTTLRLVKANSKIGYPLGLSRPRVHHIMKFMCLLNLWIF